MACYIFLHLGVSFDVCCLHTHHLSWLVAVLSLNSPPVPIDPGIPSFQALVFVVASVVVLFSAASIPSASPLMEILLLRDHPCNHGLPVEVVLPVLFLCLGMCDHDIPSIIPVSATALARCVTNFSLPRTCSWKGCDPSSA